MILLPRRRRLGLAIGGDSVRAVALRGGRIAWAVERPRGDEPLERTIGQLLADAPIGRWRRPSVIAAIGPAHAQTKRLAGLPPVTDRSRLSGVVREGAARFFLKNGVPLVTTWTMAGNGTPWGAAVDQPVLDAVQRACRARRLSIAAIVPTVAVLGNDGGGAGAAERIVWNDGTICAEIVKEGGQLVAVRRMGEMSSDGSDANAYPAALDALGPGGARFADALGAAQARRETIVAWHVDSHDSPDQSVSRWRLTLAAGAMMLAVAAWLAAPGIVARSIERNAVVRLTKLAAVRGQVAVAEREVAKVTAALGEVAAFDAPRYSMTRLLSDVARALPDESALTTLRVGRGEGTIVALTPRAAVVLTRLEGVAGIEGAEIIGPVTRDVVAGKALERVTVRFRVSAAARRRESNAAAGVP